MKYFRHFFGVKKREVHLDPDEVLLDAFNIPSFDTHQFEGRVEHPIGRAVPSVVGGLFLLLAVVFLWHTFSIQVLHGETYVALSKENRLSHTVIFSERGIVYDRYGVELAWNAPWESTQHDTYARRMYIDAPGFAHVLGYVGYPERDSAGKLWRSAYVGIAGVENVFDETLSGENGLDLVEVDALGAVRARNLIERPADGESLTLTIDADVQEQLFAAIKNGAQNAGFVGGAGVIMDVHTGEVLALTSYPEYDSQTMTDGENSGAIAAYSQSDATPFINRALSGEYAPGSIVKPFVAAAALTERIVSEYTQIFSSDALSVPNPYNPELETLFHEWKRGGHGLVDVRNAIALSSNIYFYTVGGGTPQQEGLGIARLSRYAHRFGLGEMTGIELSSESAGVVPTPQWKEEVFGVDDPWVLGNTYHTAIGQFGFLMTPIQAVRYIATIANGGALLSPHIVRGSAPVSEHVTIDTEALRVVREGMRLAVTRNDGTARAVHVGGIELAGKTGTAQVGANNEKMNSWVVGFWPASDPTFAFATVLEKAPAGTLAGAAPAMQPFFYWLVANEPEYARGEYPEN